MSEPTAKRQGATKKTAMLVDVTEVKRDDYTPTIIATGTVQAARDITLSPRVTGEIIRKSPNFVPGGIVKKGEVLLQIDPSDYKNTIEQRKSELRQAKADLNLEEGRQEIARQDYQLIGDTLADENKDLVLRKPQLESVKATIESTQASLNQAELNLKRTTIRAPFDAHIISQNVNLGSQVNIGNMLGRLVGTEEYWITASIPLSKVNRLSFPTDNKRGGAVKVKNQAAWPDSIYREGYLYKQIGALEDQTRLARVLVSVPDPLARNIENPDIPPLMIGSFVETHIKADKLNNIIRLNRDYLRQEDKVWVMQNGKLRIKKVNIVFKDSKYAYIKDGLKSGDKIVTTNLSTVVDGSDLRTQRKSPEGDSIKNTTESMQSDTSSNSTN